jgi:tetratricopeptide (TPR) repeat protein
MWSKRLLNFTIADDTDDSMKISPHISPVFFFTAAAVIVLSACASVSDVQAREKSGLKGETYVPALTVPDREIRYEDTLSPDWKENWDRARALYREKKFREALVQYEFLLAEKENIDEARWEYTMLLLHLERWQAADEQLEKLTESQPDNRDYRLARARVYVAVGKLDPAIQAYEQLYSSAPDETEIVPVLEGLVMALKLQKRDAEVIPYLERLIVLQPDNTGWQVELAALAIEQGQLDKAENVLAGLEQGTLDDILFRLQALLQEKQGNSDAAAGYWQQLVSIDPDNIEAHTQLYRYYRDRRAWTMSLKHVEVLLKKAPHDTGLLEAAAELNIRLGRVDRALEYYEYILVVQPANRNILQKKRHAQKQFAKDLVVLVENDGSQQLWQDLIKVTADRPGVYREIAGILREKGKFDELIEVLTLIVVENPDDEKTLKELAVLLEERGRDMELRNLLDRIQVEG